MTVDEKSGVRIRAVDHGLGDGRMLIYQGARPGLAGGALVQEHRFVGASGLVVLAAIEPTERGERLHISVSYPDRLPSRRDLEAVSAAFFPPGSGVLVRVPHPDEDSTGQGSWCHLWEVPGAGGIADQRQRSSPSGPAASGMDRPPSGTGDRVRGKPAA